MTCPRITGSWIDVVHINPKDGVYWNRQTLAYSDADWDRLVGHLRNDLGITLLMLQNVARDGGAVYSSRVLDWQWKTVNCRDPLEAIMAACDRHAVDFFPGIGFPTAEGVVGADALRQPLLPAAFDRVWIQIEAAAPFVERIVAYTVPGLMTSQQVCPNLGVPETEDLYRAYRQFRETMP